MKKIVPVLLAVTSWAMADIIPFELKDGLSPVPLLDPPSDVVASAGSGDAIESGIIFDTDSGMLVFVIGYGSSTGFGDLTGPATAAHIQRPGEGTGPDVELFNLWPQHFPNQTPETGGILRGAVVYEIVDAGALDEDATEALIQDLMDGNQYVNVHTEIYPEGEIRGFLVPVMNRAPTVTCAEDVTVECEGKDGTEVILKASVSDPEGDALVVAWLVDGRVYHTEEIPAGEPGAITEVEFTAVYGLGDHVVKVTATDAEAEASCESMVLVEDTTAPKIKRVMADRRYLWPPNHKMVPVRLKVRVEDCSPVTWKIVEVTSNEPVNGKGDGNTSPDWEIADDHKVMLRAERSGGGDGREYTIMVEVEDAGGLTSRGRVVVAVPHDMRKR